MTELLDFFKTRKQAMVDLLTEMVNYESFSHAKADVDKLAQFMATTCREFGADSVEVLPQTKVGDFVLAKWNPDAAGKPILMMGHLDTVWKIGTLADRPVTINEDGILFGPGAVDMKGGNTIALSAIKGLVDRNALPERPIWVFFNTDEEIGSKASKSMIESLAQDAGLVIVMEPPTPDGALKTRRKGVASYRVRVHGRSSHAGNAPEEGLNAIIELARQALEVNKLNNLRGGTSVSVTMIDGGSAGNVIPEQASMYIDTRTITKMESDRVAKAITNLQPQMPGIKLEIEAVHSRPPMEYDDIMQATFAQCKKIAENIGITVREDSVGGGSDGNFTAAMGIPTLDGIGAHGDGLHALHEQVIINSLPERAALIAGILLDWEFEK